MNWECPDCGVSVEITVLPVKCACRGKSGPYPEYIKERRGICLACPYLSPEKQCGKLVEKGKPGIIMHPLGIPNPKAHCPIGNWEAQ